MTRCDTTHDQLAADVVRPAGLVEGTGRTIADILRRVGGESCGTGGIAEVVDAVDTEKPRSATGDDVNRPARLVKCSDGPDVCSNSFP